MYIDLALYNLHCSVLMYKTAAISTPSTVTVNINEAEYGLVFPSRVKIEGVKCNPSEDWLALHKACIRSVFFVTL